MAGTTIDRAAVADVLANMVSMGQTQIAVDAKGTRLDIDPAAEVEYQTDKQAVKLVPCRECKRPIVVTTFFAPAKAICRGCSGETGVVASVGQPIPGSTDPAKAVNLADCLINAHFAHALCPVHPDDEAHEMELKSVTHSDNYGPGHFEIKNTGRVWVQDAKGEVVQHQCKKCSAVVTYQTTIRTQLRRQNAPKAKPDMGAPERVVMYGLEDERFLEDTAA
jgi:hypothetical protein